MKRTLQFVILLLMVFAFSGVSAQGKAKIVFDKMEHDFGTFKESDGVQTTTFTFTNKGVAPLILNSVRASCGCTTPKWTREPVAPGATGEISVSYNPQNRPGAFNKSVSVSSNAENSMIGLRITGSVEEREKTLAELYPRQLGSLRVKTNHISFSKMTMNETKSQEMELVNDSDKPVTIGFKTVPAHISAKAQPQTIAPHEKGKLVVAYDAGKAGVYGFASHRIYLSLDGSNDYKNSVGVSATIEEDFSALTPEQLASAPVAKYSEMTYDFGDMRQGDKKEHTFMLTNSGKSELIIRNVRSSCGCTAVAPSKSVIAAGEEAPIKVTFDSRGKRGRQSKTITVITNDPKNPTATLRISSNILTPES